MTKLRSSNLIVANQIVEHLQKHLCISYKDIRVIYAKHRSLTYLPWYAKYNNEKPGPYKFPESGVSQNYTNIINFLLEQKMMVPMKNNSEPYKIYSATKNCIHSKTKF